jgi:poly(3-hydroxybutyrate) depolymerase
MDAAYYLETIKTVFQDFSLPTGKWFVKGKQVRPQDITGTALLTVEGELDDISGSGQTRAAHGLCKNIPENKKHHYEAKGAGHYGIFSGRRWREMVYPEISAFIRKHAAKGSSGSATARAQGLTKRASVKKVATKVASKRPVAKKAAAKKNA